MTPSHRRCPILIEQRRCEGVIHYLARRNLLEFFRGILFEDRRAGWHTKDALPFRPRFLNKEIIFTDEDKNIRTLLRSKMSELGKFHYLMASPCRARAGAARVACIKDATSEDAKRRARRSSAAVSSGTNSLE